MSSSATGLATLFNIAYDRDLLLIATRGYATASAQGETMFGYSYAGAEAQVSIRFGVDKPYNYIFTQRATNAPEIVLFGQAIPCLRCPTPPTSPMPRSGQLLPNFYYSTSGIASSYRDRVHPLSTFNTWLSMSALGPIGEMQQAPIPPSSTPSSDESAFIFEDATSGLWFDPPITDEYTYTMSSPGSLFTAILDFPTGFADPFEVVVGGNSLGYFLSGQMADFSAFPGGGVSEFVVRGINPGVDVEDAAGFPCESPSTHHRKLRDDPHGDCSRTRSDAARDAGHHTASVSKNPSNVTIRYVSSS